MTTLDQTQFYHNQAQEFFETTANQTAREKKFVQRQSPLDGSLFLLSLVLTAFEDGTLVLDQLAVMAHQINHQVAVTGQAFKERFTPVAVSWLQALLAEALKLTAPACGTEVVPLLAAFRAVYLLDSSTITLPDRLQTAWPGCGGAGAKAALKLYLLLDWLTGRYQTLHLEAGRKADQNMGARFLAGALAGALWLFDLGFFNFDFLAQIAQAQSFFLCRLPAGKTLWCRHRQGQIERLDLDRLLRRAPRQLFELEVYLGTTHQVRARLIVIPAPRPVAAARRRRCREAARTQGRTPSQQTLNRCDWTLLLTNAAPEHLPTSTVLTVYGVRWQVELAFKLFKSDLQLERTNASSPCRVHCEFYANLIALLFFNRLSGLVETMVGEKISPAKLFRRLRCDVQPWLSALGDGTSEAIHQSLTFLARYAIPSRRHKYPSTRQRLEAAGQAAHVVILTDPLGYLQQRPRSRTENLALFRHYLWTPGVGFEAEPLLVTESIARHKVAA